MECKLISESKLQTKEKLKQQTMAATSPLSKSIFNISKSLLKEHPSYSVQSLLSRACSSTSYERAQQDAGNRAPIETREHERDVTIDNMSGVIGFVADVVRDGAAKTTEVAENLVDLAKETMDSAYDNSHNTKKTTQKVPETLVAEADGNVVDTSEYRSIGDQSKHLIAEASENVVDTSEYRSIGDQSKHLIAEASENVVDTSEYRSIEDLSKASLGRVDE